MQWLAGTDSSVCLLSLGNALMFCCQKVALLWVIGMPDLPAGATNTRCVFSHIAIVLGAVNCSNIAALLTVVPQISNPAGERLDEPEIRAPVAMPTRSWQGIDTRRLLRLTRSRAFTANSTAFVAQRWRALSATSFLVRNPTTMYWSPLVFNGVSCGALTTKFPGDK